MESHRRKGAVICALAATSWAGTAPGISYLQRRGVPNLTLALWRDAFVAIALFAFFAFRPGPLRVTRRILAELAIVGAICVGFYHILWMNSVSLNGPAIAVVLVYTYNVWTALGARLLYKEPLHRLHLLAIVLSLVGLVLAVRAYDPSTWNSTWKGTLIGVSSALVQAGYVLANQRFATRVHPFVALAYQMLFATLLLVAVTLMFQPGNLAALGGTRNWLLAAFLGFGPTLGGYGLFNLALRHLPGKSAGLITMLEVPIAAALSWIIFGESLTGPQYLGLVIVIAASALANQAAAPRSAVVQP